MNFHCLPQGSNHSNVGKTIINRQPPQSSPSICIGGINEPFAVMGGANCFIHVFVNHRMG